MIDGIPNRPLYFYQKDILAVGSSQRSALGQNPKGDTPVFVLKMEAFVELSNRWMFLSGVLEDFPRMAFGGWGMTSASGGLA